MNKAFDYLGRVTIPKEFRDRLGIAPEDKVRVTCSDGVITLEPVKGYCYMCGTSKGPLFETKKENVLCEACLEDVCNDTKRRR